MDGRGQEGDFMFEYVSWAEVKPFHKLCMQYFTEMQRILREDYKIRFEIRLVGSGSHRLVTRNEKEPFDLDYNLVFHKLPNSYQNDSGKLKRLIRSLLDKAVDQNVSFGQDSTSSITYLSRDETGNVRFSFDVAILSVAKKTKKLQRLIHRKDGDDFVWNDVFNSDGLDRKEKLIKERNLWNDLKEVYLKKKNDNLRSQDPKSSYILYIEAVNEVCQKS